MSYTQLTQAERYHIHKVLKGAMRYKPIADEIIEAMMPLSGGIHTITFDNGFEFTADERRAKAPNANIFFAHPYSSWERGVNENMNGLIRQDFPKGFAA